MGFFSSITKPITNAIKDPIGAVTDVLSDPLGMVGLGIPSLVDEFDLLGQENLDAAGAKLREARRLEKMAIDLNKQTQIREMARGVALGNAQRQISMIGTGIAGASFLNAANSSATSQAAGGIQYASQQAELSTAIAYYRNSANESQQAAANQQQTASTVLGLGGQALSIASGLGVF